ncbi:hypothetical protein [Streptomyces sp. NPDC013489]|uniref:hypothetical protein n=1 Tax=Streptomyces sp. NPDC013489 TaxID=3155606 RepID=UPI0033F7C88C
MSTQIGRPRWATYNTPSRDRYKAKRSQRKAREDLQKLIEQAPTPTERNAMTQNRADNYWSDEAMEARQEARRQLIQRCGNPTPRPATPRPLSEREERLAAGLIFADREDRIAENRATHAARRRRADAELAGRDRIHSALRDREGSDYADGWMNGGDAA